MPHHAGVLPVFHGAVSLDEQFGLRRTPCVVDGLGAEQDRDQQAGDRQNLIEGGGDKSEPGEQGAHRGQEAFESGSGARAQAQGRVKRAVEWRR